MANKKTKKPARSKKVYMSASLITAGDKIIRPGDIVSGLSDAEEKMYLDSGMIYAVGLTLDDGQAPETEETEASDEEKAESKEAEEA